MENEQMSLNRVMMIGNLSHDPEIRYTLSGLPLVNFSVAIDESYLDKEGKRQERVVWHRIVAAGKLALVCREYLKKGRHVFVEGRLRYAEWESNSDGRKQYRTEVVAARVQFLGSPSPDDKIREHDGDSPLPAEPELRAWP
jgi:single-strand DNA-binding protein